MLKAMSLSATASATAATMTMLHTCKDPCDLHCELLLLPALLLLLPALLLLLDGKTTTSEERATSQFPSENADVS